MKLKALSNEELNSRLKALVRQERELRSEILHHIAEVDRRRLYLKMAFPNLFSYLTEHLGYSAGSAQRRIDAARLLNEVPQLTERLESGALNLSQVSVVQKAIRQKRKETRSSITRQEKQELLESLAGQTFEATQKIVAQTLDLEIQQSPQIRHQKDSSVRFEVTLSQEQWAKLLRMREMLSGLLPNGSWDQVLEAVADKVISQKTKPPKKARVGSPAGVPEIANSPEPKEGLESAESAGTLKKGRPLSPAIKKWVLLRDQCCQFVDPVTQRKCASKWQLQIDHIRPLWAGGGHEAENLRVLCRRHNHHRYQMQAGLKYS